MRNEFSSYNITSPSYTGIIDHGKWQWNSNFFIIPSSLQRCIPDPEADKFVDRSRVDFMHQVCFEACENSLPWVWGHTVGSPCYIDRTVMIAKRYKSHYSTDPACPLMKARLEAIIQLPSCESTPCHTMTFLPHDDLKGMLELEALFQ